MDVIFFLALLLLNISCTNPVTQTPARGLDQETVSTTLRNYRHDMRRCYEEALKSNKKTEGKVSIRWTVTPTGTVEQSSIAATDTHLPELDRCVLKTVQNMKFPTANNGQPTFVVYPWRFTAKD